MIVREKVWQKSMARLLRRDEDDDVNGIKRIVTGGLIDRIEMESRRGSIRGHGHGHGHSSYRGRNSRSVPGNGFVVGATTPRPSHESDRSSAVSSPANAMTPGERRTNTTPEPSPLERRNTNEILHSLPRGSRSDMPPPPYMGQPTNEGTYSSTGSGSNTGTGTGTGTVTGTLSSHESPLAHQGILRRGTISSQTTSGRPLPLAPPEVDRVVERKIDQLAASGTGTMDAYSAMQLGMVIGSSPPGAGSSKDQGPTQRVEDLVDQKLGSYARTSGAGAGGSGAERPETETMEQLVDRKIAWAGEDDRPNLAGPLGGSPSYDKANPTPLPNIDSNDDYVDSPIQMMGTTATAPPTTSGQDHHDHPPRFQHRANTTSNTHASPPYSTPRPNKGKAAEAGFSITNPSPTTSSTGTGTGEMTLEEMIEIKMASLRASNQIRPQPLSGDSGKKGKRKGKGKGRARAGSDPGPALERHDETDDEE
jgi:hypothetical protein